MLPPPGQLALFLTASLALTLTPGPAVLFIVARTMGEGRRAGLLSVAGIGLGNAVHAGATSLGLAALLASSDRKSTRLNSSHSAKSRMPSSA